MPPDDQIIEQPEVEEDIDLHELLSRNFDAQEEDRPRGPDGKFVKSAPDPEDAAPVEAKAEPTKPDGDTPATEATEKPDTTLEAPAAWRSELKEAFKALPTEAKQILLTRHHEMEADYTRKTMETAAFRKDFEPVARVMAPHMDAIRRGGFTPETLINAWMGVESRLIGGQGVSVVRDMVDRYKIDRQQIARELGLSVPGAGTEQPAAPDGQQPIQLPPELVQKLQLLEQGHNQVTQILTAQQQREQREAESRVMSTIGAFRDAKDSAGNLLHPYYDELETDMVNLLNAARASGQEPTLDVLYDKAVWANTSTRQKTLDAQRAAEEAQRVASEKKTRDEARAKAERARKAGSAVTGTPGSGQAALNGARTPDSVREAIAAAIDAHADA